MQPNGPIRNLLRKLNNGLLVVLKPLQIVNNFLFLAVAYFVGVGISSLLYRMGPGKKMPASTASSSPSEAKSLKADASTDTTDTYWRKLPQVSRERNAWLRPF